MNGTLHIANMQIQSSGTYVPQYNRAYQAECDENTLSSLSRRIDEVTRTNQSAAIDGRLIAGMSEGLIMPSSHVGYELKIPGGWDSARLRFILEVHNVTSLGTKIFYINGYSEYNGITMGNSLQTTIDPNMSFFINSILTVSRQNDYTGTSATGYTDSIMESAQIIDGRVHVEYQDSALFAVRPTDIYTGIQSNYLASTLTSYHGGTVLDDRIDKSGQVFKSNRANSIPSVYLGKMIDTYRSSAALMDFGGGADDIYSRAIQSSYETAPYENEFMSAVNNIYGQFNVTRFTLHDLEQLDPGCSSRIQYHELGHGVPVHTTQDGEYWTGSGMEQQAATLISHGVAALLMDCKLLEIGFTYTNRTIDGQARAIPFENSIRAVTAANMTPYIDRFLREFCDLVMPDVTRNNLIGIQVSVFADLFGDTRIDISIEGGPSIPFIVPQFADALRVPVITTDQNTYNGMITGVEEIVNNITDGVSLQGFSTMDI